MRVELIELLQTRALCHPSRIMRVESEAGAALRVHVAGFPWWLEEPTPPFEGEITFHLEGISDGHIGSELFQTDPFEEDLGLLDACLVSERDWGRGGYASLFCRNPLTSPLEVYARVHDFLRATDCPYPLEHYLNMGASESLDEFVTIASASSFKLCEGPAGVCDVVSDVLNEQGVEFNAIETVLRSEVLLSVRFSDSHLICQRAYAVFDA